MFVNDPMAMLLKLFACTATFITLIYSRQYVLIRGMLGGSLSGEFYVLALLTLLGQMIMISGNSFLIIYLGLELMSLSLYALVALRRDNPISTEAAMKYFVLGALASGFMLYGMSMLYGATGSLNLTQVAAAIAAGTASKTVLVLGLVFMVAGLAFKLGAAPFHMWAPDVYQGAPTSVTLLLGAAPKLAAFAICMRLL
jgi:NADH-quinone oxidoreductase subunit N